MARPPTHFISAGGWSFHENDAWVGGGSRSRFGSIPYRRAGRDKGSSPVAGRPEKVFPVRWRIADCNCDVGANAHLPVLVQVGQRPLHHVPPRLQTAAVLPAVRGDLRLNAQPAQNRSPAGAVLGLVGQQPLRHRVVRAPRREPEGLSAKRLPVST